MKKIIIMLLIYTGCVYSQNAAPLAIGGGNPPVAQQRVINFNYDNFKLIPEDAIKYQELQSPKYNNTVYKVDGVYVKQFSENKYWYKVGNGSSATVSVNKNGIYKFHNTTSSFNPLKYFSVVGFQSKSNDHWYRPTVNSSNGNPFDLKNFKI